MWERGDGVVCTELGQEGSRASAGVDFRLFHGRNHERQNGLTLGRAESRHGSEELREGQVAERGAAQERGLRQERVGGAGARARVALRHNHHCTSKIDESAQDHFSPPLCLIFPIHTLQVLAASTRHHTHNDGLHGRSLRLGLGLRRAHSSDEQQTHQRQSFGHCCLQRAKGGTGNEVKRKKTSLRRRLAWKAP
jgi:hypothetical protein